MTSPAKRTTSLSDDETEWKYGAQGLQGTMATADAVRERPLEEMRVANGNSDHVSSSEGPCSSLLWEEGGRAPVVMRRGTATVARDTVYFNSNDTQEVYGYRDVAKTTTRGGVREVRGQWFKVMQYPIKFFSLTVVCDMVTGVGGISEGVITTTCSNKLLSLDQEGKWAELLLPMPTPRGFTGVVATEMHLVVAGGGSMESKTAAVEVLDIEACQWSSAHSLPQPLTSVSMAIVGGGVYLGGFFCQKRGTFVASHSVLTCSLDSLLPRRPGGVVSDKEGVVSNGAGVGGAKCEGVSSVWVSNGGVGAASMKVGGATYRKAGMVSRGGEVWRNVTNLPTACSTLVALGNRLFAVGGVLLSGPYSSKVYGFDARKNSWSVMGGLGVQRSLPLAAVVPGNRLVVVGGLIPDYSWGGTKRSDTVEIFTAVF